MTRVLAGFVNPRQPLLYEKDQMTRVLAGFVNPRQPLLYEKEQVTRVLVGQLADFLSVGLEALSANV